MLRSVYINNIALIKSQTLDFCDGFNVLSGETGAGNAIEFLCVRANPFRGWRQYSIQSIS